MTPKEKAKELVDKFARIDGYQDSIDLSKCKYEKKCALTAVDEIIDLLPNINLIPPIQRKSDEFYFQYWNGVKKEIKKL
jgi:hypothetical protein